MQLRSAEPADGPRIRSLLRKCELPSGDIDDHLADFIVATDGDSIIGVVGLEVLKVEPNPETKGSCDRSSNVITKPGQALLRSLAVAESCRGKGLATSLCDRIQERAQKQRINDLYLLTTTAESFFLKRGFSMIERADVPAEVSATEEFRNLCPSTAVCMRFVTTMEVNG